MIAVSNGEASGHHCTTSRAEPAFTGAKLDKVDGLWLLGRVVDVMNVSGPGSPPPSEGFARSRGGIFGSCENGLRPHG